MRDMPYDDLPPDTDFGSGSPQRPIGYFVHHQGRGHANRCREILSALPETRPAQVFCARPEMLGDLPPNVGVTRIPSLFEAQGTPPSALAGLPTPETLHCAPVGWPGIRRAMAQIVDWFDRANPALMVCDVSAEIAQLARICSVPHVMVLQHGDRGDAGHRAAYDGAAGILAPFDRRLAQPDWDAAMLARTGFFGGLGLGKDAPTREAARARLGLPPERRIVLALSGGGGDGMTAAPLAVGARACPDDLWITVGEVRRDWHATEPPNLQHRGWVDTVPDHIAAADVIVASTGNTTCQQILAAGRAWIAVPEWRYFDEQVCKAAALAACGAALHLPHMPGSAQGWRRAIDQALSLHNPVLHRAMVRSDASVRAAAWLDGLATRLWADPAPAGSTTGDPIHASAMPGDPAPAALTAAEEGD